MRQFANVSYSPWANPYSTGPNAGKNIYATPAPQQPVYRRIVLPPAPVFYHPDVEQVVGEDSDDDDSEEGQSGVPVDNALVEAPEPPPPTAPEPPPALEPPSDSAPESASAEQPPRSDPPADPSHEPSPEETKPEAQEATPTAGADNAGDKAKLDDVKDEPPGVDVGDATAKEAEDMSSPAPVEASAPPTADEPGSVDATTDKVEAPAQDSPPPPPPESSEPAPSVQEEASAPIDAGKTPPVPPIDTSQEPAEKSGESEQAAQEPPMSPSTKSVHFSPDVKDPDAASIGNKKKGIAKKIGKGKATGFVRIRDPVPVRPSSPKEERKPAKDDKKKAGKDGKKKEKSTSAHKDEKQPVEKDAPLPTTSKKKLNKAEERKKKKHDEKDKKDKGKKIRKGSDASHTEESPAIEADEQSEAQDSSVAESTAAPASEDSQPTLETQDEPATDPPAEQENADLSPEASLPVEDIPFMKEAAVAEESAPVEESVPPEAAAPTEEDAPEANSVPKDESILADDNVLGSESTLSNDTVPAVEIVSTGDSVPTEDAEISPVTAESAGTEPSVPADSTSGDTLPNSQPVGENACVEQPPEEVASQESQPEDSASAEQPSEESPAEEQVAREDAPEENNRAEGNPAESESEVTGAENDKLEVSQPEESVPEAQSTSETQNDAMEISLEDGSSTVEEATSEEDPKTESSAVVTSESGPDVAQENINADTPSEQHTSEASSDPPSEPVIEASDMPAERTEYPPTESAGEVSEDPPGEPPVESLQETCTDASPKVDTENGSQVNVGEETEESSQASDKGDSAGRDGVLDGESAEEQHVPSEIVPVKETPRAPTEPALEEDSVGEPTADAGISDMPEHNEKEEAITDEDAGMAQDPVVVEESEIVGESLQDSEPPADNPSLPEEVVVINDEPVADHDPLAGKEPHIGNEPGTIEPLSGSEPTAETEASASEPVAESEESESPVDDDETAKAGERELAASDEPAVAVEPASAYEPPEGNETPATERGPAVESVPNPVDVAIVEKILKVHSTTVSGDEECDAPDPVKKAPEVTAVEPPEHEDVADMGDSDGWDEEPSVDPAPVTEINEANADVVGVQEVQEAEHASPDNVTDTRNEDQGDKKEDHPETAPSDTNINDDSKTTAPQDGADTVQESSKETHVEPSTDEASTRPDDGMSNSKSTPIEVNPAPGSLDTDTAVDPPFADLQDEAQTDESEHSTPLPTGESLSDRMPDSNQSELPDEVEDLASKDETVETKSEHAKTEENTVESVAQNNHAKEDLEGSPDVILDPVLVSQDLPHREHDESKNHDDSPDEGVPGASITRNHVVDSPEPVPNTRADQGDENDDQVDDMASTSMTGGDVDKAVKEIGEPPVAQDQVVDSVEAVVNPDDGQNVDDESAANGEEDCAVVSDLQVPSDAPSNETPTQEASNTTESEEAPQHPKTTPIVASGASANGVMDKHEVGTGNHHTSDSETGPDPGTLEPAIAQHDSAEIVQDEGLDGVESMSTNASADVFGDSIDVGTKPKESVEANLTGARPETFGDDAESALPGRSQNIFANVALDIDTPKAENIEAETEAQMSELVGGEPLPDAESGTSSKDEAQTTMEDVPQDSVVIDGNDAAGDSIENPEDQQENVESVGQDSAIKEAIVQAPETAITEPILQDPTPESINESSVGAAEEISSEDSPASVAPRESEVALQQEMSDAPRKEPVISGKEQSLVGAIVVAEQQIDLADAAIETPWNEVEAEVTGQDNADEVSPNDQTAQTDQTDTQEAQVDKPQEITSSQDGQAVEQCEPSSGDVQQDDGASQDLVAEGVVPSADVGSSLNDINPEDAAPESLSGEVAPVPEQAAEEAPVEAPPQVEDTPMSEETPNISESLEPMDQDQGAASHPSATDNKEDAQNEPENIPQPAATEEMDEVQPTTPPAEPEEPVSPVVDKDPEAPSDKAEGVVENVTAKDFEPRGAASEEGELPVEPEQVTEPELASIPPVAEIAEEVSTEKVQEPTIEPATEEVGPADSNPQDAPLERSLQQPEDIQPEVSPALEQSADQVEPEDHPGAIPNPPEEFLETIAPPQETQPQTPPNESAVAKEPTPESTPRDKHRRRHSHAHRDSKHSHRRRESNASTNERPMLNPMALFAAAKLVGSAKNKRRDSMTDREYGRHREKLRDPDKESSSSKERPHREHRSHRRHHNKRGDKESERRTYEEAESEAERRHRREARRAEKERLAQEEAARQAQEEDERKQKRREERRARKAEEERMRKEEEERLAREEEEKRIRHEKRRQRHEAEKAEQDEEERRLRRHRRAQGEREKRATKVAEAGESEPRDAARRAAEDDESAPPSPVTLRPPTHRHTSDRRREAPLPARRNSLLGGFSLFGRSKTDPVVPSAKPIKPVSRVRTDPTEAPPSPVDVLRKNREDRASSQHSSNESRERAERPHRNRRHSHVHHRRFNSAEEEAEYRARKEERRRVKALELEMSRARDGGVPLNVPYDDAPPTEPAEPEVVPKPKPESEVEQHPPSPFLDDAAAVVGAASTSSGDRHERRRTNRRVSIVEHERPKSRRISVIEKERPASRRTESDRPCTRGTGEERIRPRRSETERSSRSKKKDDAGIKGFFGGLKRIVA